jgi:hypothetical protein
MTAFYRIYSAEPRHDRTASWGPMTTLYEVDEDGLPLRQLNLHAAVPFVHRFDRDNRPFIENLAGERRGEIRSEPLDVAAMAPNQITAEEFEFSWESGLLRDFAGHLHRRPGVRSSPRAARFSSPAVRCLGRRR